MGAEKVLQEQRCENQTRKGKEIKVKSCYKVTVIKTV